jgi:alkylation response protein AidB-like acyl-CoA dehydrogenase
MPRGVSFVTSTFENRRKIAATERGWLPENWAQFAELGCSACRSREEDGGYGGGPIETMIVMEEFGKGLVLEPFLPTVVLGGGLIAAPGRRLRRAPWRHDRGQKQFALAWLERQSRYNLADVPLKATKERFRLVASGQRAWSTMRRRPTTSSCSLVPRARRASRSA